jgi:hypothetical protein
LLIVAKGHYLKSRWAGFKGSFNAGIRPELFPILGVIFSVFLTFRSYFLHGSLPGDTGDARGNVAILDHWFRVFQGKEGITEVLWFYPIDNVVGSGDAFFLQGVFYSINRLIGIEMIHSAIWAAIFYATIGLIGFYVLLKNLIKSKFLRVLTLACIANSYPLISQAIHPQLLGLLSVSWFGYFCLRWARDPDSGGKWFYLSIIYLGIAAVSTWYVVVSIIFYSVILIPVLFILKGKNLFLTDTKFYFLSTYRSLRSMTRLATLCYTSLVLLLGSLFLRIYGYNIKNGVVSFGYGEVLNYSPRYGDLLNTSRGAFGPWIGFFEKFNLPVAGNAERAMGYPPILFALFISMLAIIFARRETVMDALILLKAFIMTNFLMLAIIITDDQGHSPWFVFYEWVPLLGSARCTFRFNILLTFILLVAAAYYFDSRSKIKFSMRESIVVGLLFISIFTESIRTFPSSWTPSDYLPNYASKIIADISSQGCRAFLLVATTMPTNPSFLANDAAAIAVVSEVPTLNGSTSVFPKNWDLFWVSSENYEARLDTWLEFNSIPKSHVCTFIVGD